MDLVVEIFTLTSGYPASELYGLVSQTRRAAVSIPANIAEGRTRGTRKEFRQFLIVSYSSGAELETHLEIAKRLSFGKKLNFARVDSLLAEVMRMLNSMLRKFSS